MKKLIALLLLSACGPGGAGSHLIEPTRASQGAATSGDEVVACSLICEEVRPQLERDFAVLPQSINCFEFNAATTCRGCNALFESKFGVLLTQCP